MEKWRLTVKFTVSSTYFPSPPSVTWKIQASTETTNSATMPMWLCPQKLNTLIAENCRFMSKTGWFLSKAAFLHMTSTLNNRKHFHAMSFQLSQVQEQSQFLRSIQLMIIVNQKKHWSKACFCLSPQFRDQKQITFSSWWVNSDPETEVEQKKLDWTSNHHKHRTGDRDVSYLSCSDWKLSNFSQDLGSIMIINGYWCKSIIS